MATKEKAIEETGTAETRTVESTLYGGNGGTFWDDGDLFTSVRTIDVDFDEYIRSIAVGYDKHEENIKPNQHGGTHGHPIQTVTFAPDEFIKTVRGYICAAERTTYKTHVIRSLKFVTNLDEYGPFGKEEGEKFIFQVKDGDKIIGFFGRSNNTCLDAIGFHATKA